MITEVIKKIVYKGFERFGRYYSIYRGFVINNEDPDGYNRLQLKVPHVYGNEIMTYWAYQKDAYSGPGYGCKVTPQIKDVVWVEFEMGDPRRPVWSFGHFSRTAGENDIPEELVDPKIFWFKTPGGILIELDDNTGEVRVSPSSGGTYKVIADQTTFNEGDNEGLVKVKELTDKLNNVESKVNTVISRFNAHIHTVAAAPGPSTPPTVLIAGTLTPTVKTEIENPDVTH